MGDQHRVKALEFPVDVAVTVTGTCLTGADATEDRTGIAIDFLVLNRLGNRFAHACIPFCWIAWRTDQGSTNIHTGNYNNTQLSDTEVVAAIVASTGISGSDKTTIRNNIGAGTSSLALGTTSTTALAGNTTTITSTQASNITTNNAKVSFPGFGTTSTTALVGNTALLQIGTSGTTAMAGNTEVDNVDKTKLATVLASFNSGDTVNIGDADDDTTVVIRGNLQVDGATTTVSSETLTIADNKIVLNNNYTGGSPSENAGIEMIVSSELNDIGGIRDAAKIT